MKPIIFIAICLVATSAIPLENLSEQSKNSKPNQQIQSDTAVILEKNDDSTTEEEPPKVPEVQTDTKDKLESKENGDTSQDNSKAGEFISNKLTPIHELSQSNLKTNKAVSVPEDVNPKISSNVERLDTPVREESVLKIVSALKKQIHEDVASPMESVSVERVIPKLDQLPDSTVIDQKKINSKNTEEDNDIKTLYGTVKNTPQEDVSYTLQPQPDIVPSLEENIKFHKNTDLVSSPVLESKHSAQVDIEASSDELENEISNQYKSKDLIDTKQVLDSTLNVNGEKIVSGLNILLNKEIEQEKHIPVNSAFTKLDVSPEIVDNSKTNTAAGILVTDKVVEKDDLIDRPPIHSSYSIEQGPVHIVRYISNQKLEGGYDFSYETQNGITRTEEGQLKKVVDEKNESRQVIVVRGSYQYPKEDGTFETITYYADETGYHAEGGSIPKPVVAFPRFTSSLLL